MTAYIINLAAVTLTRNEDWQKTVVFYTDSTKTARENLTGKTITAEIRWRDQFKPISVTVDVAIEGEVTFAMDAIDTGLMQLGQIPFLYIAVDGATWGRAPVDVLEGIIEEAPP